MATTYDMVRIQELLDPGVTLTPEQLNSLQVWADASVAVVDSRVPTADCMTAAIRQMLVEHLAAHYYEIGAGKGVSAERLTDHSVNYATERGGMIGLTSTRNGRIAIELDCTGVLAQATKPRPAFAVLDQNR